MVSTSTITLDKKLAAQAQALADAANTSIDDVIAQAIQHYVQYRRHIEEELAAADRDVEAGRVYSLEETRQRIQQRRRARRAAKPSR